MNENENIAKPMLEIVDKRIRKIVNEGADFRLLRNLYVKSFSEKMKDIAGTSVGFAGLSEYIILRTILDFLEALLESLYIRPAKILELKSKRTSKKK